MSLFRLIPMAALCAATLSATAQSAPITLSVDLTDAPRKILHATETIPVQPGPVTLVYPEWIPGEHGPTGPIINQAGFVITTPSGQPVKWERDLVDMYSYHVTVPAGIVIAGAAIGVGAGVATGLAEGIHHQLCRLMRVPEEHPPEPPRDSAT